MAGETEQTDMGVNNLNTWQDRIKARLIELNMTQEALAYKIGITRGAITHYLAGRRAPSLKTLSKIADALEINPSWLHYGETKSIDLKTKSLRDNPPPYFHKVPIFTWKQIPKIRDIQSIDPNEIYAWVPHFYSDEPNNFALVVANDTMTSPLQQTTSFHEGEIIILDVKITPENGDYVVAIPSNSSSAIFRQYVIDGDMQFLKPLNPQYPITQIDKHTIICGVHTHTLSVGKRGEPTKQSR